MPKYKVTVRFLSEEFTFDTDKDLKAEEREGYDFSDEDIFHDFINDQLRDDPTSFFDQPEIAEVEVRPTIK